jgi:hypothetical protein
VVTFAVQDELEFALLALQKAAEFNGLLQAHQHTFSEHEPHITKQLEAEYLILRTVLVSDSF